MAFADEIARATDALRDLNAELGAAARTARSAGGGGEGGGGFGLGGLGRGMGLGRMLGTGPAGIAMAAANFLDPAVGLAVQSGSIHGLTSGINQSLLSGLAGIPLLGALTGADRTQRVTNAAISQASGPLEDLARYGVEVSDELIQSQIDVAIEQQKRTDTVRGRVATAGFDADTLERAGEGTGVGALLSVLNDIKDTIRSLANSGGAGG